MNHIILFSLFAIGMSILRLFLVSENNYLWLNWNLFLGLLPIVCSWIVRQSPWLWLAYIFSVVWIILLPNAPYLITDFIHLNNLGPDTILWYDGLMIFSYSLAGISAWVMSTQMIAKKFSLRIWHIGIISLLTGFGVYIGRYIRFNSWDIVTKMDSLWLKLVDIVLYPSQYEPVSLMTLSFSVFLFLTYLGFSSFSFRK